MLFSTEVIADIIIDIYIMKYIYKYNIHRTNLNAQK